MSNPYATQSRADEQREMYDANLEAEQEAAEIEEAFSYLNQAAYDAVYTVLKYRSNHPALPLLRTLATATDDLIDDGAVNWTSVADAASGVVSAAMDKQASKRAAK